MGNGNEKDGRWHVCVSKMLLTFYRILGDCILELLICEAGEAGFKPPSINLRIRVYFPWYLILFQLFNSLCQIFQCIHKKTAFFALLWNIAFVIRYKQQNASLKILQNVKCLSIRSNFFSRYIRTSSGLWLLQTVCRLSALRNTALAQSPCYFLFC